MKRTLSTYNGHNTSHNSRWFLALYFPTWSTDVTRRKLRALSPPLDPECIVLTTRSAQKTVVVRTCSTSASYGIHCGMDIALARARTPIKLYAEAFDPIRDRTALEKLAVWCLRFSPLAGIDYDVASADKTTLHTLSPQCWGITIDLTGTLKIHKDFTRLGQTLYNLFKDSARVAIAPTLSAAWSFSRFGASQLTIIQSTGELYRSSANLPIAALRLEEGLQSKLIKIGITTVDQLLSFPRHALSKRFGKSLLVRINQWTGEIEERVLPSKPVERFEVVKRFEPPLPNTTRIISAIVSLYSSLFVSLQEKQLHARRFVMTITDTDNDTITKEFSLPLAGGFSAHSDAGSSYKSNAKKMTYISSIITPVIEQLSFSGEVSCIELTGCDLIPITPQQIACTPHESYDPSWLRTNRATLINTFIVRLGKDRVLQATTHDSHTPEDSFSYNSVASADTVACHEPHITYTPEERPSIILQNPEPITTIAMLPDRPPSWIRWRGKKLTITSGFGPARISYPWWNKDLASTSPYERDYFTVQDSEGRWYWVFRDTATHDWFVHGMWS